MSKRRRVFDIEMPEEEAPKAAETAPVPAGTPELETKAYTGAPRRGPMATAIGETAESLRERRLREDAIRAENDALAHEFVRLKQQGLIVDMIPIDQVHTNKLTRDRALGPDDELDELKASILEIGLSNPIRVEQTAHGYELVQGYRRLSAYRALLDETGDEEAWGRIPAGLIAGGEGLDGLYRRMVDENLVRKDISFAEMADLARSYADDPGTQPEDVDAAIELLFKSAGRQKRNYIGHFARLLDRLEKYLEFPQAIPRALGLSLVKRLDNQPEIMASLVRALGTGPRTEAQELEVLRRFAEGQGGQVSPRGQGKPARSPRTTFRMRRPEGEVKCTAADGRLELRLNRDFSAEDRRRLEIAVQAFFDQLDG
ncbi:MAG: ParB N-terminal domain-containing protein [Rhodobacteraceae bacterium]|nr:ParB N-terminal domain-containing protein [Paracoccaceae bacterium]